jgi:hypothetical protein
MRQPTSSEALLSNAELDELRVHEERVREDDFILRWVTYGSARTDAPVIFHTSSALVLVATAIHRQRWLDFAHKRVYPSLYVLNLADSGQRKSTPLDYAKTAVASIFPSRLLANEYSPEALVRDLDKRSRQVADGTTVVPGARGVAFVDEAGRLLGTMRRSSYAEGLKDVLAALWDAPPQLSRILQKGDYQLRNVYVNLVLATTTTRFIDLVTPEDIGSGFLARFLPFVVHERVERRPLQLRRSDTDTQERVLAQALQDIGTKVEAPSAMDIDETARARLDQAEVGLMEWAERQYNSDLACAWTQRLSEYAQRLAIVFAVSEAAPTIELPHVLRAVQVVDRAKEDVQMLIEDITKGTQERDAGRVERFILNNPGITKRELARTSRLKVNRLDAITLELEGQERIKITRQRANQWKYYPVRSVALSTVNSVDTEVSSEVPA